MIPLMKDVARNYGHHGISANAVAPGAVEGFMIDHLTGDERATFIGLIPIGRFAAPIEVARGVGFLASDGASFVNGATIDVNGGWIMS